MSSWPEAVYVIREMRKTMISADLLDKLANRRNVIAEIAMDGNIIYPDGHSLDQFSDNSLWLINDDNDEGGGGGGYLSNDCLLTVIDSNNGHLIPSHQQSTDTYLSNSVWLITDT